MPSNDGLLLHDHNHVETRQKEGPLETMVNRDNRLTSSWA